MNDVCDAIQNKLVKLHLTGISIEDDPEVRTHLADCSACRMYHDFLNHDHRALEVYAKSLDIYVDQVKHRLHRQIEHGKPGRPNRAALPWWTAAPALLLIAGLIFLFTVGPDQSPTNTQSIAESPTLPLPAAGTQTVNQIKQRSQDDRGVTPEPDPTPVTKALPVERDIDPDANGVRLELTVTPEEANQPLADAEGPTKGEPGLSDAIPAGATVDHVGTVLTAQGDPAPNIEVFLCQSAMEVSVNNGIPSSDAYAVRTDGEGRFLMDSERPVKTLVAVGTEGIAQIEYDTFQEHRIITLAPWVTVKGDLVIESRPEVGYMLETLTRDALESRGGYDAYSQCNTDAEGRFEFNRIPPGHMILYGRDYEVRAGQTYELHLPVAGRSVTGQFVLPGYARQGSDLSVGHVINLDADREPADISPLPETMKSQVFQEITCGETGRFQVDHLEPGHYALVGGLLENGDLDRQKHAYRLWQEFAVPEPPDDGPGDTPIDLGDVEFIPGDLLVSDKAPEFDLLDLDGNTRSLSDAAEKLVLLSFYRSDDLRRPSSELLALSNVQAQFGSMESFVMMGMLASDYSPAEVRELVDAAGLTWPHLRVGRNGFNRTHIEYDVINTPWPWNILISSDGEILAIGLQGDELAEAIETHLP